MVRPAPTEPVAFDWLSGPASCVFLDLKEAGKSDWWAYGSSRDCLRPRLLLHTCNSCAASCRSARGEY